MTALVFFLGLAALIMAISKPTGKGSDNAPILEGPMTPAQFVSRFKDAAARIDLRGFEVRALLAVSSLETGSGTGGVFRRTRNLFSITKGGWKGPVYTTSGGLSFRKYDAWQDSIADFVKLMGIPYYAKARAAAIAGDAKRFFVEIKAAGYDATSPTYAKDLARVYDKLEGLA